MRTARLLGLAAALWVGCCSGWVLPRHRRPLLFGLAAAAASDRSGDTGLAVGQQLRAGDWLLSPNQAWVLAVSDLGARLQAVRSAAVLWQAAAPPGRSAAALAVRPDGLELRDADGGSLWRRPLPLGEGSVLRLKDSGALVLVSAGGRTTWLWSPSAPASPEPASPDPAAGAGPSRFLSCAECVGAGFGWCLARRKCVPDQAWICQGDTDHVSPPPSAGGRPVGRGSCPTKDQLDTQRRSRAALDSPEPTEAPQGSSDAGAHYNELLRRARAADGEAGAREPYKVLGVEPTAPPAAIRRAYRELCRRFHPDKNSDNKLLAERAISDINLAYERVGNPDKRAAFDEYAGPQFEKEWSSHRWKGDEDFYWGDPLIATLTSNLWARRLVGDSIWLVELYAAWCPACRRFMPSFRQIARGLEQDDLNVGAVNCVKHARICQEVGVSKYPTLVLLNRQHGTVQHYKFSSGDQPTRVAEWARRAAREWQYLFGYSRIKSVDHSSFERGGAVRNSTDAWVVMFMDGTDCGPCKTAKTNLMRLSASMRPLPVQVGIVDCQSEHLSSLCYDTHRLPQPPHRPILKMWPAGAKHEADLGETLYNANELEPHLAMMMLEKTLRLALADRQQSVEDGAVALGKPSEFESEAEEDERQEADRGGQAYESFMGAEELLWNGPEGAQEAPKPWNDFGQANVHNRLT